MNKIKLQISNNDVLKDKIFDMEMIYSFFISAILHVLIVWFLLFTLWSYFGVSYDELTKNLFVKPDIIFRLEPLNPAKSNIKEEEKTKKDKNKTNKAN